ncbi:Os02g0515401 [Oryza sativa Japonica Group]|uniref:Os02g0515401 protein n=1 Tax=Oryza sativa subsp. japonica TaxID=39947 RepID=A0A0P0VJJ6_ORYSJ|nr:Os02g0515401 [Oryza sativa Japonica Group]
MAMTGDAAAVGEGDVGRRRADGGGMLSWPWSRRPRVAAVHLSFSSSSSATSLRLPSAASHRLNCSTLRPSSASPPFTSLAVVHSSSSVSTSYSSSASSAADATARLSFSSSSRLQRDLPPSLLCHKPPPQPLHAAALLHVTAIRITGRRALIFLRVGLLLQLGGR